MKKMIPLLTAILFTVGGTSSCVQPQSEKAVHKSVEIDSSKTTKVEDSAQKIIERTDKKIKESDR